VTDEEPDRTWHHTIRWLTEAEQGHWGCTYHPSMPPSPTPTPAVFMVSWRYAAYSRVCTSTRSLCFEHGARFAVQHGLPLPPGGGDQA
jgi:hypothetical protein